MVATSAMDNETSFQLYDLFSHNEAIKSTAAEEALFCRTGEKRNQWAKWAYAAFNERRIAYGFNELKEGIVEHSACEFTRYLRESMRLIASKVPLMLGARCLCNY